jgi:hypothetical protein
LIDDNDESIEEEHVENISQDELSKQETIFVVQEQNDSSLIEEENEKKRKGPPAQAGGCKPEI